MIDDIDYLIKNSEKDSQVVYIDSGLRNKLYYPNANEYTIEFAQPFKFVYGFDVLDAAVPVTMYNIDVYNNSIYFMIVNPQATSLTPIDPSQYLLEITTCETFTELYDRDEETFIAVGYEQYLSGYLNGVGTPDKNYVMYYRKVITTSEIKIRTRQSEIDYFFFSFNGINYCIKYNITNQDLIDKINTKEYSLTNITQNSMDLVYFEKHIIDKNTFTAITNANSYIITISNYIKSLEIGNYDILTIINDLNDVLNPYIDVSTTTAVPKKQAKMSFTSSKLFLFNGNKGNLIKSLGFDTYPAVTSSGTNYNGWTIGSNFFIYGAYFNATNAQYQLISPGLISLLGERFAILRIKEIEDHLSGSFAYMNMTPGIGMFKMAAAFGGITNLRFDYTTILKKPFHPIGKLSKLSIRFETSSGNLYDFKGVNHQLMLNIKYYVPTQKQTFGKSILNPNYNPNVIDYMASSRNMQNHEDSDEEDENIDEEYQQYYKKQLNDNAYSSSEEDTDDESFDESEEEV